MYKYLPILFFSLSFSVTNDSLLSSIIDLSKLNYNEKMDTLRFVKNQSNKIILFFPQFKLKVQNIISIDSNNVEVELLDSWWWNKPKSKHSVFYNISSIESTSNKNGPSYIKRLPIQDIIAVQMLDKNRIIIFLLPTLLILLVMQMFGLL